MAQITEEQILSALGTVSLAENQSDVVSAGIVQGISIRDGNVAIMLEIDPSQVNSMEPVRKRCEEAVFGLKGVASVTAVMTEHKGKTPASSQKQSDPANRETKAVPGVAAILAVASGKGGVGKSTTSVNLALSMSKLGKRVGIMDADVYGPSIPTMMGLSGKPHTTPDGKQIEPKEAFNVRCMSIGLMVPKDTPMIWRGPMVMSAVQQLLYEVHWGELDVLVIDMPPGTGDAQLTLAQRVPITGSVIVSTPQDVALLDVRKGLNMFREVDIPVFGIVENMSYFSCPNCGERSEIFGHGGAEQTAAEMGTDFLGAVPLHLSIRETSDTGKPIAEADPDNEYSKIYRTIAEQLIKKIEASADSYKGPLISLQ